MIVCVSVEEEREGAHQGWGKGSKKERSVLRPEERKGLTLERRKRKVDINRENHRFL